MTLTALSENLRARPVLLLTFVLAIAATAIVLSLSILEKKDPVEEEKKKQAASFTSPSKLEGNKNVVVPSRVKQITPKELDSLLKYGQKINLIHIASASEWQEEHLPKSLFMSFDEISKGRINLPQNSDIVFISKDGVDAVLAVQKLVDIYGFNRESVRSLEGGMYAWKKGGFKVEP